MNPQLQTKAILILFVGALFGTLFLIAYKVKNAPSAGASSPKIKKPKVVSPPVSNFTNPMVQTSVNNPDTTRPSHSENPSDPAKVAIPVSSPERNENENPNEDISITSETIDLKQPGVKIDPNKNPEGSESQPNLEEQITPSEDPAQKIALNTPVDETPPKADDDKTQPKSAPLEGTRPGNSAKIMAGTDVPAFVASETLPKKSIHSLTPSLSSIPPKVKPFSKPSHPAIGAQLKFPQLNPPPTLTPQNGTIRRVSQDPKSKEISSVPETIQHKIPAEYSWFPKNSFFKRKSGVVNSPIPTNSQPLLQTANRPLGLAQHPENPKLTIASLSLGSHSPKRETPYGEKTPNLPSKLTERLAQILANLKNKHQNHKELIATLPFEKRLGKYLTRLGQKGLPRVSPLEGPFSEIVLNPENLSKTGVPFSTPSSPKMSHSPKKLKFTVRSLLPDPNKTLQDKILYHTRKIVSDSGYADTNTTSTPSKTQSISVTSQKLEEKNPTISVSFIPGETLNFAKFQPTFIEDSLETIKSYRSIENERLSESLFHFTALPVKPFLKIGKREVPLNSPEKKSNWAEVNFAEKKNLLLEKEVNSDLKMDTNSKTKIPSSYEDLFSGKNVSNLPKEKSTPTFEPPKTVLVDLTRSTEEKKHQKKIGGIQIIEEPSKNLTETEEKGGGIAENHPEKNKPENLEVTVDGLLEDGQEKGDTKPSPRLGQVSVELGDIFYLN